MVNPQWEILSTVTVTTGDVLSVLNRHKHYRVADHLPTFPGVYAPSKNQYCRGKL